MYLSSLYALCNLAILDFLDVQLHLFHAGDYWALNRSLLLVLQPKTLFRKQTGIIIELTPLVSTLWDHSPVLPDVQCLKTVVLYILSSFLIILGCWVNSVRVTPSWPEAELAIHLFDGTRADLLNYYYYLEFGQPMRAYLLVLWLFSPQAVMWSLRPVSLMYWNLLQMNWRLTFPPLSSLKSLPYSATSAKKKR